MQPPLTPDEKQLLLRLLKRERTAWRDWNKEMDEWTEKESPSSEKESPSSEKESPSVEENDEPTMDERKRWAIFLAQNGAHQLAIEAFGDVMTDLDSHTLPLWIAISAWLNGEKELATAWAEKALPLILNAPKPAQVEYERFDPRLTDLFFVVSAWAAKPEDIQQLLQKNSPPKRFETSMLRAAIHRDLDFLVDYARAKIYASNQGRLMPELEIIIDLEVELIRMRAGKPNQLETKYETIKALALKPENEWPLLSQLKGFVGRQWKDLERYMALLKEMKENSIERKFNAFYPFVAVAQRQGDLYLFESLVLELTEAGELPELFNFYFAPIVRGRSGYGKALENF